MINLGAPIPHYGGQLGKCNDNLQASSCARYQVMRLEPLWLD